MDARDFAVFYPRLAAELRQIELDAMGRVQTSRGLHPTRQVLPEAAFAGAVCAAVTVWLVLGLICWGWAGWWWILAAMTGTSAVWGVSDTARCARTLARRRRGGQR
ncbi:hypothetical protein [Kutzneria sp. NPDC051319]|uniref:hypothetical protein n=1 Tax=Kutzneria sp. NPDC051319 TaxID=3155047 RepID=UPI0034496FEC